MRTRKVDTGSVELSIAEAGEGGKPLLLLHGFTGAKEDLSEFCDPLAESGWHVVAPDHRGHGESSKPGADSDYSIQILAQDALSLANRLAWDGFVLLGHSMGGYIAQQIAFEAPERLNGLVLMDTGHVGPQMDPALVAAAIGIVQTRGIDALADMLLGGDSPLDTPAHRRLMAESPGYAEFESRKLRSTSPHLYAAIANELPNAPDHLDRLARLPEDLPVLVLVGEQDAPFLEDSRRMAEAIAGAKLALIPDAGHSPQFENPEGWWKAISVFLASDPVTLRTG